MNVVELVILLAVAAAVGLIAQSLTRYWRGGVLLAILLGFVGALIGTWLARELGLPEVLTVSVGGVAFPIVWAVVGAILLVGLVGLLSAGGFRGRWWGLTPPSRLTLIIAMLLAALSVLVTSGNLSLAISAYALLALAFLVLLTGNLVRGL
jgi:uncharacterized membrane protein YeaQ/YmgE (transglycosylase-associated protein family)